MSLDTAITAIRNRAESLWPSLEPNVLLTWPNEDFELPTSGSRPDPFVVLEVRWSGGGFESVGAPGSNLTRRLGHIWIFATVPSGTGEIRAHQLLAKAIGMFEGQAIDNIVICEGAMVGGEADEESGNYFIQSAAIPFDYDETA